MFFNSEHYSDLFAAKKIFVDAEQQYPAQIFRRVEDINYVLHKYGDTKDLEKQSLSKSEAWKGFKWKAENPHRYISVIETAILPGSRKPTHYGEIFTRLTIQPSFVTGELVIVKEAIHIFENENTILFLGQEVDPTEAEKYLKNFKPNFLAEKPALFHVEHALTGTEEQPSASWQMVRLCDRELTNSDEAKIINSIRKLITDKTGIHIYVQTIKQLSEETTDLTNS